MAGVECRQQRKRDGGVLDRQPHAAFAQLGELHLGRGTLVPEPVELVPGGPRGFRLLLTPAPEPFGQALGFRTPVDETRREGGVSEALLAALCEGGFRGGAARVASADSFIPLGDAANLVLVQEAEIEEAARELCR